MTTGQATGFAQSLLRLVDLDWLDRAVPDYSTLCRRRKTLNVSLPHRGGAGPLHLPIDRTGIKSEGEGAWNARKHGVPRRRIWRRIPIGPDAETLEVRAVEVTTSVGAIARNEAVNASRYPGRAIWRRWTGYHHRSRVESKMHCVKPMGQSLMARDFGRQVAEVQTRIAALSRHPAPGIPVTVPAG